MQTNFTLAQLADPSVAEAEQILRKCVHCGFCTATCPTYALQGDELDSPRGRIYMIKSMLEESRPANDDFVTHIDRCLSCLSCMTTCPSGVHYMHLVDHARAHIEETYKRGLPDRLHRAVLAALLPYPSRFRLALAVARLAKPFFKVADKIGLKLGLFRETAPTDTGFWARLRAMMRLVPRHAKPRGLYDRPGCVPAETLKKGRVALLAGCAHPALAPEINEATVRILTRLGMEVVVAEGAGCCGALVHHLGHEEASLANARANIDAWHNEIEGEGLDAIIINASGCGTTVKDYGFMLREDDAYANKAEQVANLAKDITEFLAGIELPAIESSPENLTIAYHSACSMQHGQQIKEEPKTLLRQAGFEVLDVPEGHFCCGSAGTYNILQPGFADRLLERKVKNIESLSPDVIATGNIGCMTQIGTGTGLPIVHTVELLDWASGGPKPKVLDE